MSVGEKIKHYRKLKNLTQAELAKKTDLSTMTIRRYEKNERSPDIETLNRIASALDVDVFYLQADENSFKNLAKIVMQNIDTSPFKELDYSYFNNFVNTNEHFKAISQAISQQIKDSFINTLNSEDVKIEISNEKRLANSFDTLNETGQNKVIEYAEDLSKIKEYKKTSTTKED